MAVVPSLNSRNYRLGPRFYRADWPIRLWSSQGVEGTSCRAGEASPSCGEPPKHGKPRASELFIRPTPPRLALRPPPRATPISGLRVVGNFWLERDFIGREYARVDLRKSSRGMTMALLVPRRSI